MKDEDVNLDVSWININSIKYLSVFQNYIYSYLDDFRNMLIQEANKREITATPSVHPPFSI